MQVTVENTGVLERRMTVVLPATPIEEAFERKLAERARSVRVKGFRPGKVPIKEARRRFGKALRMETAMASMEAGFHEALREQALNLASAPTFEMGELKANADLKFTAIFEVFPEIALGDFSEVRVEQPVATVTDADVDAMVETLRVNHRTWHPVERPAQKGDRVTADLVPCVEAEFNGEDMLIWVEEAFPMPGIADAAAGMSVGETKRVSSEFPALMDDEALREQAAEFDLTVKTVAEARLPALDDAFFATLGVTEGGEAKFRAEVRQDLETRLTAAIRGAVHTQVLRQLVVMHEFELPKALVERESKAARANFERRLGQRLDEAYVSTEMQEEWQRQGVARVCIGLLVNAVVEKEGITPDGAKVRERVEEIARGYEQPEQVVNAYYRDDGLLGQVESAVLEDQVVEKVLAVAQVTLVERSYQEVLNPPQAMQQDTPTEEAAATPEGSPAQQEKEPPAEAT